MKKRLKINLKDMFADTDFILAIIKESDWLKERVGIILREYKGKITTSISVMLEVAIVCKRLNMNIIEVYTNTFKIIEVNSKDYSICLKAAVYIEEDGLNVFDAFHAASSSDNIIISSDSVYDKIGIKRLKLEE